MQGEGVLAAPGLSSEWHGCPSPAFLERLGLSELFHRWGWFQNLTMGEVSGLES